MLPLKAITVNLLNLKMKYSTAVKSGRYHELPLTVNKTIDHQGAII
jgi:hypothetical protein